MSFLWRRHELVNSYPSLLLRATALLVVVLIVQVTVVIVLGYDSYLPPDFQSDFLHGRQGYFWDGYHVAFYAHIFSGPVTLIVGLVLMNEPFRRRFGNWHRNLGRLQVACILLLLVPSGLWMSAYSQTGVIAATGFASLALATGLCCFRGWRSAMARRYAVHRIWMTRCFVLLCSAVVLRLLGGVFTIARVEGQWSYDFSAWASWIAPLSGYELIRRFGNFFSPVDRHNRTTRRFRELARQKPD